MTFTEILTLDNIKFVTTVLITPAFTWILFIVRKILRRIELAEWKHVATIDALELQFKNGFKNAYDKKLAELKSDHKFINKGE